MRLGNSIQDHCDVRGLLDHDEYSDEFSRLLCVAQNEGVSFSECVAAAKLIRSSNGPGWRQAWEELARSHLRRAQDACRTGNELAAQKGWLHAANYFMAAAIESCPEGAEPTLGALAHTCLRHFLAKLTPQGETVVIPWLEERSLEGFYLPVTSHGANAHPVVVCIAETRRTKEEILSLVLRSARQRGMALLCVDLPDEAPSPRVAAETGITAALDYLIESRGTDPARIAVIGDGSPSSLVTRGIALDGRAAAAVCDGGLWDLWAARQTDACGAGLGMVQAAPPAAGDELSDAGSAAGGRRHRAGPRSPSAGPTSPRKPRHPAEGIWRDEQRSVDARRLRPNSGGRLRVRLARPAIESRSRRGRSHSPAGVALIGRWRV